MLDNMKPYTLYQYKANTPQKKRSHIQTGFIFKDMEDNIFEVGKKNSRKFNKKLDVIYLEESIHDEITGFELDKYNDPENLKFEYCMRQDHPENKLGTKILASPNNQLTVCLVKSSVTTYERLGYMLLYNKLNHSSMDGWMYYDSIVKEFKTLDPALFVAIKWALLKDHAVWFRPYMDIPIMKSKEMSDVYEGINTQGIQAEDILEYENSLDSKYVQTNVN